MSENPFRTRRLQLGLSARELAVCAGVDATVVSQVETGRARKPAAALLAAFERFGIDSAQLTEAYDAWRRELAESVLRKTAGGQDGRPTSRPPIALDRHRRR